MVPINFLQNSWGQKGIKINYRGNYENGTKKISLHNILQMSPKQNILFTQNSPHSISLRNQNRAPKFKSRISTELGFCSRD